MMTENTRNYFEILDLKPDANQHDILMAYQRAKAVYSFSNPTILEIFSEEELRDFRNLIEEAYSILKEQSYRAVYEKRIQNSQIDQSRISLASIKEAAVDYQDVSIIERTAAVKPKIVTAPSINEDLETSGQPDPLFEKNEEFEKQITTQIDWDGDSLKKVREYRKISIDLLQEKTKVKPWYLTALENMDPKNLPAPVFVRGYVIQVARELGLDDKRVAESYMKNYKEQLENNDV